MERPFLGGSTTQLCHSAPRPALKAAKASLRGVGRVCASALLLPAPNADALPLLLPQAGPVRCSAATQELPKSLQTIVGSFQAVADPMQVRVPPLCVGGDAMPRHMCSHLPSSLCCHAPQRYKQLLFYATKLEPLPAEDHTSENKVQGCVSQVWVVPRLGEDGTITWRADSDSQLTKVGRLCGSSWEAG